MSSALTFKFMTTELIIKLFLELFPVIQKILPLTSICDKLLGSKYRVFVKSSHVKLFLWVKILIGHKQRHPILAQLLVWYNDILRKEIFLWASDNFSTVYSGKPVFHLNQFIFASGPNFDNKNLKLGTSRNT